MMSDDGALATSGLVLERVTFSPVARGGCTARVTFALLPARSTIADGSARIVVSTMVISDDGVFVPGTLAVTRERPACSACALKLAVLSPAPNVTDAGTSSTSGDDDSSGIVSGAAGAWPMSSFSETRAPVAICIDAGVIAPSSLTMVTVAILRPNAGATRAPP